MFTFDPVHGQDLAAVAGTMKSMMEEHYLSWRTETVGKKILNNKRQAALDECAQYTKSKG
jgi:hypothetical protein